MKGVDYMLEINMGLNYFQKLMYYNIQSIVTILIVMIFIVNKKKKKKKLKIEINNQRTKKDKFIINLYKFVILFGFLAIPMSLILHLTTISDIENNVLDRLPKVMTAQYEFTDDLNIKSDADLIIYTDKENASYIVKHNSQFGVKLLDYTYASRYYADSQFVMLPFDSDIYMLKTKDNRIINMTYENGIVKFIK